jgi:hypothetical protein
LANGIDGLQRIEGDGDALICGFPQPYRRRSQSNGASVISLSPFIGVELTSWKARTLPQVTAVFDPGCVKTQVLLRFSWW